MPELLWLQGYSGQTVDQLLKLERLYRIDSLVHVFEQALNLKAARVGKVNLSIEERTVLAIEAFEREVNNGGFDRFFINSSREFAPIIVESLYRIGCPETADLTQTALDALGLPDSAWEAIEEAIVEENQERDRVFKECDSLYFQREKDIEAHVFAFIKLNKSKFEL